MSFNIDINTDIGSLANNFQAAAVQKMQKEAQTGILPDNKFLEISENFETVYVARIETAGALKNYNPAMGAPSSKSTMVRDQYKIRARRSMKETIDRLQVEQQGNLNLLQYLVDAYLNRSVIPEIDSFRLSNWADQAILANRSKTETLNVDTIFPALSEAVAMLKNNDKGLELPGKLYLIINSAYSNALRLSPYLTTPLVSPIDKGIVFNNTLLMIDDVPVVAVNSSRMKTDIKLAGDTNEDAGGIAWGANSKNINYILLSEGAYWFWNMITDTLIVTPEENRRMHGLDAWRLFSLLRHDAGLIKGMEHGVFVSISNTPLTAAKIQSRPQGSTPAS